jgi:hypothetical protein
MFFRKLSEFEVPKLGKISSKTEKGAKGNFWSSENNKNRRRISNQPIKITFIRFQVVLPF